VKVERFGRKSVEFFLVLSGILSKRLRKTRNIVRIVSVPVEIRIGHLRNTSDEWYNGKSYWIQGYSESENLLF
jgi:hypothetical protein